MERKCSNDRVSRVTYQHFHLCLATAIILCLPKVWLLQWIFCFGIIWMQISIFTKNFVFWESGNVFGRLHFCCFSFILSLKADKGTKHMQTVQVSSLQVGHFLILSGLGDRGSPKAVCWASVNEGCIEIAPLFFRLLPTKGLFPIQDTRSLDNIDTGTSRPHSGGGLVQQTQGPASLCKPLNTPETL